MITDDTQAVEATENDFAAFEAAANAAESQPEEAQPEEEASPVEESKGDEEGDDHGDEEQGDDQPKKRRSKPASERIAEVTAKWREAERRIQELEAKATGVDAAPEPVKPDPESFEFGEADPDYLDALTDYKLEVKEREKAKETAVVEQRQAAFQRVNEGIVQAEQSAKAKYDDFDARIAEAAEARAGVPLPPMLTMGIGLSPVGGDIIYRLATDDAAADKMEQVAQVGGPAFAIALGELEGEYMDDESDSDLDLSDQIDMVRKLGRMNARLRSLRSPSAATPKPVTVTNAPEPPKQRMRGGSGQFGVSPDTTDFAAFEKLASAGR